MRVVEALAEVARALLAAPVDLLLLLLIFSTLSERIKDVEDRYFCSVGILKFLIFLIQEQIQCQKLTMLFPSKDVSKFKSIFSVLALWIT